MPNLLDLEAWLLDPFACIPDREFAGINDLSPENARRSNKKTDAFRGTHAAKEGSSSYQRGGMTA